MQTTVQPVFVSRKIAQDLKVRENKPQIVNQQRVVYRQCDLCYAGYMGYTRGHLHTRVEGHKQKASSVYKHYHEQRFNILKKCRYKFDWGLGLAWRLSKTCFAELLLMVAFESF